MKIRMDLHTHLTEKKIKPANYWNCVKNNQINTIAITEHVEMGYDPKDAYKELIKTKPKNINLIPGMETRTDIGHLLVYGENEDIYEIDELYKIKNPYEKMLKKIKKENLTASFAHPYGFPEDSCAVIKNEEEVKEILKKNEVGIEAFNGMLGNIANFVYEKDWLRKPMNFFDFLEGKNNKTIKKIGNKAKIKLENTSIRALEMNRKAYLLAQSAKFATAGSDAHYPERIGSGMIIINTQKTQLNNEEILKLIKTKKPEWIGPNIDEQGNHVKTKNAIKKTEFIEGMKYAIKKTTKQKLKRKKNKE